MGKCGDCSDCSCDDSCEPEAPTRHHGSPAKHDATDYLKAKAPTGIRPDDTPLGDKCQHFEYGTATRSQCNTCVISWVLAVDREVAEQAAEEYAQRNQRITADRIRRALAEYHELAVA